MSNRPNQGKQARTSARIAEARGDGPASPARVIVPVVLVLVALAAVVAVVATRGNDDSTDVVAGSPVSKGDLIDVSTAPAPVIKGASLPPLPETGTDPAVGKTMPELEGVDLAGQRIAVATPDGTPKMVIYLAHWCPHCQKEVPELVEYWKANGMPDGVEVQAVTTGIDENKPNYPPGEWLVREGWPVPTLVDSKGEAAEAAGLTGFPFYVFIDGNSTVVKRTSGEVPADELNAELEALAAEASAPVPTAPRS